MARRESSRVVVLMRMDAEMIGCNAEVIEIVASEPLAEVKMSY